MLTDRKEPLKSPIRTKLFKRYDIFTGEIASRRVNLSSRPIKEKSNYAKVSETLPHGFGRSQGICQRDIDKLPQTTSSGNDNHDANKSTNSREAENNTSKSNSQMRIT